MYRPQYWAVRYAFTGQKPINNVPSIQSFELSISKKRSGTWIPVSLDVFDVEDDEIEISFYYNQRTGSRKRRNQINTLNFRGSIVEGFEIQLPEEHGTIKVYVHAKDSYNNLGIASTAIEVVNEKASQKKYLVPKAILPFYVY